MKDFDSGLINVKCVPIRETYFNESSGFRVLACSLIESDKPVELNKIYNNFSISGCNIPYLRLGEPTSLVIAPKKNSKYEASYDFISYGGIELTQNRITVKRENEFEILNRLMTSGQANNVLAAYPDFVELVLNDEIDQIDYNKIYGVGEKYLAKYIRKIKEDCQNILFKIELLDYGDFPEAVVEAIAKHYGHPSEYRKAMEQNPYHVFMDVGGLKFEKADPIVLNKDDKWLDSEERCVHACREVLQRNQDNGDTKLNANIMAKIVKGMCPESYHHIKKVITTSPYFHYDSKTLYVSLIETYQWEQTIAKNLLTRIQEKNDFSSWNVDGYTVDRLSPMNWLKYTEVDGFKCTDEQAEILKTIASGEKVCVLTGSGGSGKSTCLKSIIKMFDDNGLTYALLAPTGIAAKRMKESTGKESSTIHRFLSTQEKCINLFEGPMSFDYLIIDEMSMVGVELFARLLNHTSPRTSLILICDEAQLASISCGNIVHDILSSGKIPVIKLTKIFRYGVGGIATMSTDARMGHLTFFDKKSDLKFDDFQFISIDEENPMGQVVQAYEDLILDGYDKDSITILSPFNRGSVGTYKINTEIQEKFNYRPDSGASYKRGNDLIKFRIGDKVLNTKNDYKAIAISPDAELGEDEYLSALMNGDIGNIRQIALANDGINYNIRASFNEEMFSIKDISSLLLGYAISIHKIQGAQNKAIIVVAAKEHSSLLTRNLLYMAFSRAQERLIVISDEHLLKGALTKQENLSRDTWLEDMLLNPEKYEIEV